MQSPSNTRRTPTIAPIDLSERHVCTLGGARCLGGGTRVSASNAYRLHLRGAWDGGHVTVSAYREGGTVPVYSATFSKDIAVVLPPETCRISLATPDTSKVVRVVVTLETLDGPIPDPVERFVNQMKDARGNPDSLRRRANANAR